MRTIRASTSQPGAVPLVDEPIQERRAGRMIRAGRWFVVGLGGMLVLVGLLAMFAPVSTDEGEPSCGDRLGIVVVLGSPVAPSGDPDDAEWCREEARSQAFGGTVFALVGVLLVGWQARRARRGRRDRSSVVGIGRTSDGMEPAQPFRTLPGRLVSGGDTPWLIVEERPDQASPLMVTGRRRRTVRSDANEVEVAGDVSHRVAFRLPGSDEVLAARPRQIDRLHRWWAARSQRRRSVELAGEVQGLRSVPSTVAAVANAPQPDRFQPAWGHRPARKRVVRSLWSACLALVAAGLVVLVIVWTAVDEADWFWEPGNANAPADVFLMGAPILIALGAGGIVAFFRRRKALRRQPWRLAAIESPSIGHVVLREQGGVLGPITYRVAAFEPARVRVAACRQLWFVEGSRGSLVAATPDFRAVVELHPERTRRSFERSRRAC